MNKLYLVVVFIILMLSSVSAQSTLALQEKCTEAAERYVKRLDNVTSYTCHYNKKLDRCFLRAAFYLGQIKENVNWPNGMKTTLKHPHWMVALYDVFDSKMVGNCACVGMQKQECWVENTQCKTVVEFENLIDPYMKE